MEAHKADPRSARRGGYLLAGTLSLVLALLVDTGARSLRLLAGLVFVALAIALWLTLRWHGRGSRTSP